MGDIFTVDGNNLGPNGSFDGQGNNSNILRIVDLESKNVIDGGLTFSEGYLKFVGDVGNLATQSEIARDALEIVQTQAIEARDRVSGVNLDKEAADLIRFQQAYQASAQVMQVASKLFDAVL
ncbi:MAG: flagellar basal body rod C-terminal domain-containing protein, partial [Gammaproteobacteria bacterium]